MNLKAIFQIKLIRLVDGLNVGNECKEMKVSRIVFGFQACLTRLMPFGDLKNIWIVKGVTHSVLNMLCLRKPQRLCTGGINLGVTDVEITKIEAWIRSLETEYGAKKGESLTHS